MVQLVKPCVWEKLQRTLQSMLKSCVCVIQKKGTLPHGKFQLQDITNHTLYLYISYSICSAYKLIFKLN